MNKVIKSLLAVFVLSLALVACSTDAEKEVSKPIASADKNAAKNSIDISKAKQTAKAVNDRKKGEAKKSLSADRPATSISFDEMEHHFGTIDEGDKVEHVFTFKNTGNEPLILEKCKGSCGCTVPTWPHEPIAPGKSGIIKVSFNPKGKAGKQNKTVTIMANTDPVNTVLNIKSVVNIKK